VPKISKNDLKQAGKKIIKYVTMSTVVRKILPMSRVSSVRFTMTR